MLYQPGYIGAPLRYVFNNISIETYQGLTVVNLMDYFPLLKQGYCYKKTSDMMLKTYIDILGPSLEYDEIINKAFNDDIPVELYFNTRTYKLMPSKSVPIYINTIQNAKRLNPNFGLNNVINIDYLIEKLSSFNILNTVHTSDEINAYMQEKDTIDRMIIEYRLSVEIYDYISQNIVKTRIPLDTLVFECIHNNYKHLLNELEYDNRIKLYVAIIMGEIDLVAIHLHDIDPRNDNNEAYRLANKLGDQNMIAVIRDSIIKRNWLEAQVFESRILSLEGESDLPHVLRMYSRRDL